MGYPREQKVVLICPKCGHEYEASTKSGQIMETCPKCKEVFCFFDAASTYYERCPFCGVWVEDEGDTLGLTCPKCGKTFPL